MEAPIRYRYDPPWKLAAFLWILAAGSLVAVLAGGFPRALGIAASLALAGLGGLLAVRHSAFPRNLALDDEGVWLPSGFLRISVRRVVFAETSAIWEAFLPFHTSVLCLRYHGKTYEIVSTLLPDSDTYQAVCQHVCSRIEAKHA
jgi:hypothetical protein